MSPNDQPLELFDFIVNFKRFRFRINLSIFLINLNVEEIEKNPYQKKRIHVICFSGGRNVCFLFVRTLQNGHCRHCASLSPLSHNAHPWHIVKHCDEAGSKGQTPFKRGIRGGGWVVT